VFDLMKFKIKIGTGRDVPAGGLQVFVPKP
jgi:hypothetical protein